MIVPYRTVENKERAGRTTSQYLTFVVGARIRETILRDAWPLVRARHETRSAIFRPKLIDHKDKAKEWPIGRVAPDVGMQLPAPSMWTKCPSMKRTKFERFPDNSAAGIEQRRVYVEIVKLLAPIYEVFDARRRATYFRVLFGC